MTDTRRSPARWVTSLLVLALVALAGVVYALIRATSATPGGEATETPPDPPPAISTTGTGTTEADPTTTTPTGTPSIRPDGTPTAHRPTTSATEPAATVALPVAWSGHARITVTVLGDCATDSPSVYLDTPADLALVPLRDTADAAEPAADVPVTELDELAALSLGINATSLPSLAIYTALIDEDDVTHRYWRLDFDQAGDRTEFEGVVIDDSGLGPNPNLLVDAETSLQPCENAGAVALPRIFADGSTISGWLTEDAAHVEIEATTTDGKRSLSISVDATRRD